MGFGKYDELAIMLRERDGEEIVLRFDEIADRVSGLPKSAYEYAAWWANDEHGHVHAEALLRAGYAVIHLDLRQRVVTFRRRP